MFNNGANSSSDEADVNLIKKYESEALQILESIEDLADIEVTKDSATIFIELYAQEMFVSDSLFITTLDNYHKNLIELCTKRDNITTTSRTSYEKINKEIGELVETIIDFFDKHNIELLEYDESDDPHESKSANLPIPISSSSDNVMVNQLASLFYQSYMSDVKMMSDADRKTKFKKALHEKLKANSTFKNDIKDAYNYYDPSSEGSDQEILRILISDSAKLFTPNDMSHYVRQKINK